MRLTILLFVTHVVLPFASPFAVGTEIGTSRSAPLKHASVYQNDQRTSARYAATSPSSSTLLQASSLPVASSKQPSSLRRFLAQLNPTAGRKDGRWKGGEQNATIPARLLFRYSSPLLETASDRSLTAEDAFPIPEKRRMDQAVSSLAGHYDRIRKNTAEQNARSTNSSDKANSMVLARALFQDQKWMLLMTGVLRLANTGIQAFPAILVARLLRLVEAGPANTVDKSVKAAILLVSVLSVKMIIENQYFHSVIKCSAQVRGSVAGLIFDKSLRLPGGGSGVTTKKRNEKDGNGKKAELGTGGVLNLMQSDASILESAAVQIHTVWDGPLQIAIYTTLLYKYLGPSVWWGIGVLLTTIPISSITLRILNRLSRYENEAKDARTKRTSESIANMKLLKLQAWENRFADDIQSHRREELRRHISRGVVRALNSAFTNAVPALVLVVTLTAYSRSGRPLKASTIFTAISLFNQLRFPLFFYPMMLDSLANAKNALRRISTYLSSEEITPYVTALPATDGGSIEMKNGNFLWSSSNGSGDEDVPQAAPALCDAELKIGPGEVVAVVGPVGSGKSALVKGLLGELTPVPRMAVSQDSPLEPAALAALGVSNATDRPSVIRRGDIAYCSQEAWLSKGTIRDAIVFGRPFNETRYMEAIRDAGLDQDMVDDLEGVNGKVAASSGVLSHDTDVGEGGSSLSGGQRARVALARALYGEDDVKIFLLDDCLAALDASVGSLVFERVTRRLRRAKAATIWVTNDPALPRRCDRVLLMGKSPSSTSCCSIIDEGSYDELIDRGHDLRNLAVEDSGKNREELPLSSTQTEGSQRVTVQIVPSHRVESNENDSKKSIKNPGTIRVAGGYELPANSTVQSHHADPEYQSQLECYPDCAADHVLPVTPEDTNIESTGPGEDVEKVKSADGVHKKESSVLAKDEVQSSAEETGADSAETENLSRGQPVKPRKLTSADDAMSAGAVPPSTYATYFKAIRSNALIIATLLSYFMANGAQFFQQFTVARWTELGADAAVSALGAKYLRSLVNAAGVVSVFLWVRSYLTMKCGVKGGEFLHNRMLSSVFSAPMSFFDATPSGQILSRFGKELETVDRALPDSIGSVLFCFLQIFMSSAALAGVVTPAMLVPLSAVGVMYYKTMTKFRPAARDMKRAETKTRSPIYTQFGEALRGTEIIRSIRGATATWSSRHRTLMDRNLSVFFTVKAFDRWLSCRLETLGNTVVFTTAVASVFLTRAGRLQSGGAGWGLTQALAVTGLMTWAVRTLTDLETHMMSVLRVKELTDLDKETAKGVFPDQPKKVKPKPVMAREMSAAGEALEPLFTHYRSFNSTISPPSGSALVRDGWPWKGNIRFKNVSMRYNEISPLVLKGVSLDVKAGTTLGVVGRTGSGKSSLLLTLFRLVEIEGGGSIEIDGVDIRSLPLQTLRESLSIIPQDPVLFAGTIRYNLDATGRAAPEEIWAALEAASPELARQFCNADGLDTYISEGGKNLSLGQRQLICLARALLKRSKILVLDEATSSVDSRTDQQVQDTIRREFVNKGVSVITVAHRLETVLGYDNIAVLGNGEVLEYGPPNQLLRIPNGELRQLVDADYRNRLKGARKDLVAVAA